jgi:hypothetical protein
MLKFSHARLISLVLPLSFAVACGDDDPKSPVDTTPTATADAAVSASATVTPSSTPDSGPAPSTPVADADVPSSDASAPVVDAQVPELDAEVIGDATTDATVGDAEVVDAAPVVDAAEPVVGDAGDAG